MKTYRDTERFQVRIHDLSFEEAFHPIENFDFEAIKKIKVFIHKDTLMLWAAGRSIHFVKGTPGVSPSVWYVRVGFGRYIPCSTNQEMDEFNLSLSLKS